MVVELRKNETYNIKARDSVSYDGVAAYLSFDGDAGTHRFLFRSSGGMPGIILIEDRNIVRLDEDHDLVVTALESRPPKSYEEKRDLTDLLGDLDL